MNHLIVLANQRLEKVGKCDSCKYFKTWTEYGNWHGDCSNGDFDKLPIVDENENEILWGDEQICLLWEVSKFEYCESHGFFSEDAGCSPCELAYLNQDYTDE